jgi:hypothetical protein
VKDPSEILAVASDMQIYDTQERRSLRKTGHCNIQPLMTAPLWPRGVEACVPVFFFYGTARQHL